LDEVKHGLLRHPEPENEPFFSGNFHQNRGIFLALLVFGVGCLGGTDSNICLLSTALPGEIAMRGSSVCSRLLAACGVVLLASGALISAGSSTASAVTITPFDLLNPAAGQVDSQFGQDVTVLPNGNIVVTDPSYDRGVIADVGAVYLFNGTTRALISTLTGTTSGDSIGNTGVVVLSNGNYVVTSSNWDDGVAVDAGAVTWGSGITGVGGAISASNSLVGTSSNDNIGNDYIGSEGVVVLPNGNYVVRSTFWDNGTAIDAGAVTWGSGTTGVSGAITASNSLVGTTSGDNIGFTNSATVGPDGVVVLLNGNYLVRSPHWDNGATATNAGAVTWGNGTTGVSGAVTASNSLVGTTSLDQIGISGVTVLSNGNYVVRSPYWNNGVGIGAGAVTWGSGTTGVSGAVSTSNSLVGTTTFDQIGVFGVTALSNGNYVVRSAYWDNGFAVDAGAVTWGSGTTGISGAITASNSLVGTTSNDRIGYHVTELSNGNYVVASWAWANGATATNAGAVTWGNGATGISGAITASNSLVGTTNDASIGNGGVTALLNGNYVVTSLFWGNGATATSVGAVTWGNGATGISGAVTASNSLVGTSSSDEIGYGGVTALPNGNYVVTSLFWDNGLAVDAGAVTWGNGTTGTNGAVTASNSLVGTTTNDHIGNLGITVLLNGNYVVRSPSWTNGIANDAGAATWGSGSTGTSGAVTSSNSLVGTTTFDNIGRYGVVVLSNGNYVVLSAYWDSATAVDVGAVTWGNGTTGISGAVTASNSLVGTITNDQIGIDGHWNSYVVALSNGNYVVASPYWDNGIAVDVGAVTWGNGTTGISGAVTSSNSLVGSTANDQVGGGDVVANSNGSYLVLSDLWDNGSVVDAGAATYGPATGVTGVITSSNSAIGTPPGLLQSIADGYTTAGAYVIETAQDRVLLLSTTDAFASPPVPVATSEFVPLSPGRLADTRPTGVTVDGAFAAGGVRAAGSTFELTVAGRDGVLADAKTVSLNITAVDPTSDGYATVFPCGSTQPNASNINYTGGHNRANAVITKLGTDGKVCIFVSAAMHLIVDVNGSFPASSSLVSANPARVLDTRPSGATFDNLEKAGGLRPAGSTTTVTIGGRASIPANAKAVSITVTATGTTGDGFLTVYPCGSAVPNSSNLNYSTGTDIANLVISKLGTTGTVCIYNSAATQLIVDVAGYFPAGSSYEPLQPARLFDTRSPSATIDNLFQGAGLRPAGTVTELTVTGRGAVAANASTVVLNVTATGPTADGYISAYPCGIAPPNASNLNVATGETVANTVITKVGTGGKVCIYNSAPTHLIADVNGYLTS
jgi:Repeat of unknown function (DUF5650)